MSSVSELRDLCGQKISTKCLLNERHSGFTLAEVLAALLFMAILVPVTMHGITVASRVGMLGQRKATAMRIAERVLNEALVTGEITNGSGNGSIVEGDLTYPWTLRSEAWTEDNLSVVTVQVSFNVQGNIYDVAASTLYDPNEGATTSTSTSTVTSTP